MKKSRYTDSQIIAILKQNESGTLVADLCREHGICVIQTLYIIEKIENYAWILD